MDPKNELSDREKHLMALAWLCFSEKPKVRNPTSLILSSNPSTNPQYHTGRLQETCRPRRHDQPGLREQRLGQDPEENRRSGWQQLSRRRHSRGRYPQAQGHSGQEARREGPGGWRDAGQEG